MDIKATYISKTKASKPKLTVRRWCTGDDVMHLCFSGLQFVEITFYVEIIFENSFIFQLNAYGQQMKAIDPMLAHRYRNTRTKFPKRATVKEMWLLLKNLSKRNLYYRQPSYLEHDNAFFSYYYPRLLLELPYARVP